MALVSNRPTISCRRLRPRAYVIALKASVVTSTKQEHQPRPALGDTSHQRTGSYVNWKATAADFFKVLQCLEGVSLAKPHLGAVAALPENPCSQRKHWTGVFEGLFARNGAQQQAEGPEVTLGLEDGTTLTQAVVMFTATWCGPCSMVYRELKLAAGRLAGGTPTAILVVDVDEEKELASELGIKALPTVLYMSPDPSRGPIFTQGPVSSSFILDALDRAVEFGGRDLKAKWRKL